MLFHCGRIIEQASLPGICSIGSEQPFEEARRRATAWKHNQDRPPISITPLQDGAEPSHGRRAPKQGPDLEGRREPFVAHRRA